VCLNSKLLLANCNPNFNPKANIPTFAEISYDSK
jgi:hypothetical protein